MLCLAVNVLMRSRASRVPRLVTRTGASVSTAHSDSDDTTPFAEVGKALPPMAGDPLLASWYKDDIFRLFRKHEVPPHTPS